MAGHSHPAVMKAVEGRLSTGNILACLITWNGNWRKKSALAFRWRCAASATAVPKRRCTRAPGRAATGRDKELKFEGGYHGLHDAALVSVKPHPPEFGDAKAPNSVSGGSGVPKASIANVPVATFNDLETVELRFQQNPAKSRRSFSSRS